MSSSDKLQNAERHSRADELTPQLLTSYQRWLTLRGVCMNTVSCYMRSLRALYNNKVESQDAMAVMPTNDLFKHVFTDKQKRKVK